MARVQELKVSLMKRVKSNPRPMLQYSPRCPVSDLESGESPQGEKNQTGRP